MIGASIRALRTSTLLALLAACSEVQSIQLGELTSANAGASSMSTDAEMTDPDTASAQTDPSLLDAGAVAMVPPSAQPAAADAGTRPANKPDAHIEDKDLDDDDDDDDEDSEESPEPERRSDEEDAGEPNGD